MCYWKNIRSIEMYPFLANSTWKAPKCVGLIFQNTTSKCFEMQKILIKSISNIISYRITIHYWYKRINQAKTWGSLQSSKLWKLVATLCKLKVHESCIPSTSSSSSWVLLSKLLVLPKLLSKMFESLFSSYLDSKESLGQILINLDPLYTFK